MNPSESFFKFTLGFLTFIGLSFIITFAAATVDRQKEIERQTAAAIQAMLGQKR